MLGTYKNSNGYELIINEDFEPDYSSVAYFLGVKKLTKKQKTLCDENGYFGYVLQNNKGEIIAEKWSIPSLAILFDELVHKCVSKSVNFDSFFNGYPSHLESVKHELIGSYFPSFRELGVIPSIDYENNLVKCLDKDNKVIFEQDFKKENLYFINAVLQSELFKLQKEVA